MAAGAVLLSGCAATVSTRIHAPRVAVERAAVRETPREMAAVPAWAGNDAERMCAGAEAILHSLGKAPKAERAGDALLAARLAWGSLERSGVEPGRWASAPQCGKALDVYRQALGRVVAEKPRAIPAGKTMTLPSAAGELTVRVVYAGTERPGYYDRLIPAGDISVRGFRERVVLRGAGVPLVALRASTPERAEEMAHFPSSGVAAPLTMVAEFSKGKADSEVTLTLIPTLDGTTWRTGGRRVPLAADFTAPLAFSFGGANDLMLGIRNFLNVAAGVQDAGIYLTAPVDRRRVPVLLIHGLSSSPIVWRNMVNEAMRDEVIRRDFQFWYGYYSTGAPIVYSTAQIRADIGSIRAAHAGARADESMVVVGYSMGGVMARLLVTDIGDRLWRTISPVPFAEVNFDPNDYEAIRDSLFWKPVPGVRQVIFIATPHRGAPMADLSIARIANWLISLPKDFVRFQRRFTQALNDVLGGRAVMLEKLTGLDDLSEHSRLYRALEESPLEKGVRFYSVVGDRGRGDAPNSSDGIVPYASSYFAGAESELIVPTGHDAQAYPGTEAEVRRILRLGLRRDEAGVPAGVAAEK